MSALFLGSCSSWHDWRMEGDVARARAEAQERIDVAKCEAEGGAVRGVGIFGVPACVKPYADADKTCADESECQGLCIVDTETSVGSAARGRCQRDDHDTFGCYNPVVAGVAQERICQD
jgi:hypothetical protein